MPALMAIISGNSEPLQRELKAVQRMANQTGASLQNMGGGHGGTSGIMRETVVLMRELSRGNWSRVPGSFTILLQRMGVLNLLLKDGSRASQILADAWEQQAASASMAAVAATRKAQASLMAFEADAENTEATLAQAVADEEGAAAAIANAKATQAKAVAAQEAAAAQAATATVGVGALGVGLGVVLGLAAGIWAGVTQIRAARAALAGLGVKDFNPDYIAKSKQAINRPAEEQKQINDEIRKSVELYNSAAKAAERVSDATKNHFEHLRKMNSFERDPAKRAQRELEIDQEERATEIANKRIEKSSLEAESKARQQQAQAIQVSTAKHDEELLKQKREAMEDAQKQIEQGPRTFANAMVAANPFSGVSADDINKAYDAKVKEAAQRKKDYDNTVDLVAANDELRKKREELIKQAGGSAAAAALIGQQLPDMQKKADQANADEAEEAAAKKRGQGKTVHGSVNALQQIGAYAAPAVHIDELKKHTNLLHQIARNTSRGGGSRGHGLGEGTF